MNWFLFPQANHITAIPAGSLPPGLTSISLSDNPIATIDDNAFSGSATTLHSLSFSGANFSRIPDAFLRLQNLKYFDFYNTNIQDWNDVAMKQIGKTMINLDLENVGFKNWPTWLAYFTNLELLTMDFSHISSVPDNALDKVATSLSGLSISNGSLTSVPKTISNLVLLESLHLHANKISNLTWLPRSKTLSTLSLNNNRISDATHLSNMLRPFGQSLRSLEIERNLLSAIPDLSFLKQVSSLDFSFNKISDPTSGAMPVGLYEFDLSNNLLQSIPIIWSNLSSVSSMSLAHNLIGHIQGTDFPQFITEVDLSYNLITELMDSSFPSQSKMMLLNLNNNPIKTISSHAFDGLNSLTSLNLQHTQQTHLPLALASLMTLYTLDMSYSPSLVCTCQEKSLKTVILSVNQVFGQCGETGIQEFFSILSPLCPT